MICFMDKEKCAIQMVAYIAELGGMENATVMEFLLIKIKSKFKVIG